MTGKGVGDIGLSLLENMVDSVVGDKSIDYVRLGYLALREFTRRGRGIGPGTFEQAGVTLSPWMLDICHGVGKPCVISPVSDEVSPTSDQLNLISFCSQVSWEVFGLPTKVLKPGPAPTEFFLSGSESVYDGGKVLSKLSSSPYLSDHGRLLVVTDADVYDDKNRWMYGYAGLRVPVGIVSTHRLGFAGEARPNMRSWSSLLKVVIHEIGHTFGVPHCHNIGCVMNEVGSGGLPAMKYEFCLRCLGRIMAVTVRDSLVSLDPIDNSRIQGCGPPLPDSTP